jgi:hypothetical protein
MPSATDRRSGVGDPRRPDRGRLLQAAARLLFQSGSLLAQLGDERLAAVAGMERMPTESRTTASRRRWAISLISSPASSAQYAAGVTPNSASSARPSDRPFAALVKEVAERCHHEDAAARRGGEEALAGLRNGQAELGDPIYRQGVISACVRGF